MGTNLAIVNDNKLFKTIFNVETFNENSLREAQSMFETYKARGVIINSNFSDHSWQFCDEYANVGMVFDVPEFMYKKYYQQIFGISHKDMVLYIKAFVALSFGKNVLISLRHIPNDVKKIFSVEPKKIIGLNLQRTQSLLEFIEILPVVNNEAKESLIDTLVIKAEIELEKNPNNQRHLALFESYFKFNDLIEQFWKSDLNFEMRLFYYPLYLWWKITAILPLRPREFLLTPRNCLSKIDGKFYLTVRRNNLKGRSGIVHYNIAEDYVEKNYAIPESLYEVIDTYIKATDSFPENEIKTLFRVEPHYAMFHHKRPYISRFYTYVNLCCCLRMFYYNIIQGKKGYNVVEVADNNPTSLADNEIEMIHLGDTRHIAMINIILEGGTPTMTMELAGHSDITMSSHYYSNISTLIECKTYSMYRRALGGTEQMIIGENYYDADLKASKFVELENGARCYSPRFYEGEIRDCINASGSYGEIGYCYGCLYYRQNGLGFFTENIDIYKSQIVKDCEYLKAMLNKYRLGLGYDEDIRQALLKIQSSSMTYQKYYMQKLLYENKDWE